jgi:hypothetical protein
MPMFRSAVLGLLASSSLSVLLWAKAPTILIEVKGAGLTSPIEITSPGALNKYTFFDGPGVSTRSQQRRAKDECTELTARSSSMRS